jgi:hypothetical protein
VAPDLPFSPRVNEEDHPDRDAAQRVDRPEAAPEQLPYDEEMAEPDEANAPDAAESTQTSDMEIGAPDRSEREP